MTDHRDDIEHAIDHPVPAIVLRADEPVPASIVDDTRDKFVKRLGIVILILLTLALAVFGYRQSQQNGKAIDVLAGELRRDHHEVHKAQRHDIIRLTHLLQRQNALLVKAGFEPLDISGTAGSGVGNHPAQPAPQPSATRGQAPAPSGGNRHRHGGNGGQHGGSSTPPTTPPKPSPKPSPTCVPILNRLGVIVCRKGTS